MNTFCYSKRKSCLKAGSNRKVRSDYEEIMEAMAPEGVVHSGRRRCGISVLPLRWLQLRKLRHYCQSLELHALHGIDRFSSVQRLERRVLQTMTKGVHFPFWHTISRVCRKWQTRFFRAIAPPFFRIVLPALNNIPGKRKNRRSLIETAGLWRYRPDLNWGMRVLQTLALPLGHGTV